MAGKFDFMKSRKGTIINRTSKQTEQSVTKELFKTINYSAASKFYRNVCDEHYCFWIASSLRASQ
jgi:uncharacterized protein (DUF2344 family)